MNGRVEKLKETLRLLASDSESQLKYLEETGAPECVDELALDYDAIAAAANGMFLEGEINEVQRDRAKELNDFLGSFSGEANAHLWTPEALHTAGEWKKVRTMAKEILTLLK